MRKPRLYLPTALASGTRVALPRDRTHYLQRVLRLRPGAELTLFNGSGGQFAAILEDDNQALVGDHDARECESPLSITLLQGISRGERMEYTLRKATELGVSAIVPVSSRRCEVRLKGDRLAKRVAHWRGIVASACEQCGRNRVPEVAMPMALGDALTLPEATLGLLLDPLADASLTTLSRPSGAVALLVGPEGGLDDSELDAARAAGFNGLRLGPRVLRTETAPVAALAAIQLLWGDL